jgi:hypothetical protein
MLAIAIESGRRDFDVANKNRKISTGRRNLFIIREAVAESGIVMSFAGGISGLINGSTESVCGECGNPSQFCDDEIAVLSARHQKVH